MKAINLILITTIIIVGINMYPKINNYLERLEIEKANKETIMLIDDEDIITKEEKVEITTTTETKTEEDKKNIKREETKTHESQYEENIDEQQEAYLEVQFICQAPLQTEANWTLHEESCEEAAILQAYLYEKGESMSKEEANTEILEMIDWQNENIGGHYDLYADDLKPFIVDYFSLEEEELQIIYDAGIDDIKKLINEGHPVVVPVTSSYLNNPYYPHPGYHMLTVTGYTNDRIITNDNGTRRGEDFSYNYEDFYNAMLDSGADILYFELKN